MNWTDEEATRLFDKWAQSHDEADDVLALASLAVELARARGGNDRREEEGLALGTVIAASDVDVRSKAAAWLSRRLASRGAAVATLQAKVEELQGLCGALATERDQQRTLADNVRAWVKGAEKERDDARAEVERLTILLAGERETTEAFKESTGTARAECQRLVSETERLKAEAADVTGSRRRWKERAESAESRFAAIRGKLGDEAIEEWLNGPHDPNPLSDDALLRAFARWLEGDAPREAKWEPTPVLVDIKYTNGVGEAKWRHPCSPTCTHDDAANPGHPERVKERSDAVRRIAVPSSITTGAQVRDDEEPVAATLADDRPETEDSAHAIEEAAEVSAYDRGAEAMRAACWEAVQTRLRETGYTDADEFWDVVKTAIEGAAP